MPLPATCGEESGLPGVPGVGCVACVTLPATPLHARFDCCLTSSCTAIYLIGPREPCSSTNSHAPSLSSSVITRRVWAVPGQDGHQAEADSTSVHDSGEGGVRYIDALTAFPLLQASSLSSPSQQEDATNRKEMKSVEEAARVADLLVIVVAWSDAQTQGSHVSLLLCNVVALLSAEAMGHSTQNTNDANVPLWYLQDAVPLPSSLHVMRLFSHERFAAATAAAAGDDEGDASCAHVVLCACVSTDEEQTASARTTSMMLQTASSTDRSVQVAGGVVMASSASRLSTSAAREPGRLSSSSTVAANNNNNNTTNNSTAANNNNNNYVTGAGQHKRRQGQLQHLALRASLSALESWLSAEHTARMCASSSSSNNNAVEACGVQPWPTQVLMVHAATQEEMPRWLWQFRPTQVVSAFAVQDCATSNSVGEAKDKEEEGSSFVVAAAAGTIGGHVYLLYDQSTAERTTREREGSKLVRRLAGPISDLRFVHTTKPWLSDTTDTVMVAQQLQEQPSSPQLQLQQYEEKDKGMRSAQVDTLLEKAAAAATMAAQGSNNNNSNSRAAGHDTLALVVLDSIGQIAVLRHLQGARIRTQSVPDVAHFFALRGGSRVMPNTDLHALRTLFAQHAAEEGQREDTRAHAGNTPQAIASTIAGSGASVRPEMPGMPPRTGCELRQQAGLTGHLLSRGVLCLSSSTHYSREDGCAELIVSTMDQVLVGLRYDRAHDGFAISAFISTPYPIFEVCPMHMACNKGDVHHGSTVRLLVLAGMRGVLLASITSSAYNTISSNITGDDEEAVLCERAALLRRLLRPRHNMLET